MSVRCVPISKLTALDMGGNNYLMVEPGGKAIPARKTIDDNPVWIRFNVENIDAAVIELSDRGVTAKIRREVWGTVADFCDPDGNICSHPLVITIQTGKSPT